MGSRVSQRLLQTPKIHQDQREHPRRQLLQITPAEANHDYNDPKPIRLQLLSKMRSQTQQWLLHKMRLVLQASGTVTSLWLWWKTKTGLRHKTIGSQKPVACSWVRDQSFQRHLPLQTPRPYVVQNVAANESGKTASATPFMVKFNATYAEIAPTDFPI